MGGGHLSIQLPSSLLSLSSYSCLSTQWQLCEAVWNRLCTSIWSLTKGCVPVYWALLGFCFSECFVNPYCLKIQKQFVFPILNILFFLFLFSNQLLLTWAHVSSSTFPRQLIVELVTFFQLPLLEPQAH